MCDIFSASPSSADAAMERELIIIDTSVIVKSYAFARLMKAYGGKTFLLPRAGRRELADSRRRGNRYYEDSVRAAISSIDALVSQGRFRYIGDEDMPCPETILYYCLQNRRKEITVLTQDSSLAEDVLSLNRLQTFPGKDVLVRCLGDPFRKTLY